MIGNDIVDLEIAEKESNWKRKGFLEKIFTDEEQSLILQHKNPEKMVWILWSMKEAAYKIYNRETGIRGYFPLKLQVSDIDFKNKIIEGKVRCKDEIYETRTIITTKYIYTTSVKNSMDFKNIIELEEFEIKKDTFNRPYYFSEIENKNIAVSKTHHGQFQKIIALQSQSLF